MKSHSLHFRARPNFLVKIDTVELYKAELRCPSPIPVSESKWSHPTRFFTFLMRGGRRERREWEGKRQTNRDRRRGGATVRERRGSELILRFPPLRTRNEGD